MPALQAGGWKGGGSMNVVGMQLFGNRLPQSILKELYTVLTGTKKASHVDGVSFVGALGGVKRKTAHSWYHELNKKAWSSAFDTRNIQTDPKVAVGAPELIASAHQDRKGPC